MRYLTPFFWPLLEGKARLELMDGRAERAAKLLGASWALRENEHLLAAEAIHPDYETIVTRVRSVLGEGSYDEAFGRGRAMTMLQAIRYAMLGIDRITARVADEVADRHGPAPGNQS